MGIFVSHENILVYLLLCQNHAQVKIKHTKRSTTKKSSFLPLTVNDNLEIFLFGFQIPFNEHLLILKLDLKISLRVILKVTLVFAQFFFFFFWWNLCLFSKTECALLPKTLPGVIRRAWIPFPQPQIPFLFAYFRKFTSQAPTT